MSITDYKSALAMRYQTQMRSVWVLASFPAVQWGIYGLMGFAMFGAAYGRIMRHKWFWDFRVYQAAAKSYLAGANPYDLASFRNFSGEELNFIYAPHVLTAIGWLHFLFNSFAGQLAYLAAYIACVLAVVRVSSKALMPAFHGRFIIALLTFFFLFGAGLVSFRTGNIATPAYALCFITLFYGMRRHKFLWFYASVVLFCQIKPNVGMMLLIPLFFDARQWKPILLSGLLAFAPFCLDWAFDAYRFDLFVASTNRQLLTHDWGLSALGIVDNINNISPALLRLIIKDHLNPDFFREGLSLFFLAFFLLLGWLMRKASKLFQVPVNIQLAWCIVAALSANPRLKEYDICFAVIPFVVLCDYVLRHSARGRVVMLLGFLLCFIWPLTLMPFVLFNAVLIAALLCATEPDRPLPSGYRAGY